MKRTRTVLSLLMALLMLVACADGVFAVGGGEPEKKTAEPDKTLRDVTGELIFDRPYIGDVETSPEWTIPLTYAAGPINAAEFVPVSEGGSDWSSYYDYDLSRVVASAWALGDETSYSMTLHTDPVNVALQRERLVFRVKKSAEGSITVFCTDLNGYATWSPSIVGTVGTSWRYVYVDLYNNCPNTVSVTERRNIFIDIVYNTPEGGQCEITEMQLFNPNGYDDFANSPQSDLDFAPAEDNVGSPVMSFVASDIHVKFLRFQGVEGEDRAMGITAHVAANAGDVLKFDYVSELNYMAGAEFRFGLGTECGDMQTLYSGEEESGDGSLWNNWVTYSYTIPAAGEYDFIWVLETWDSPDSFLYLSNVELVPRMELSHIVDSECNAQVVNTEDYPWYPVLYRNEIWYRSAEIGHNGASQFTSPDNMMKEGDLFYIRAAVSSEKNYDKFNVYMLNTAKEGAEEQLIYSISGSVSGETGFNYHVPEDGIYTFRFVYQKDSSVSSGSDCAYVRFIYIAPMNMTHAAEFESGGLMDVYNYAEEPQYGFRPALFNNEVVLATDNRGVPASAVTMEVRAYMYAGEQFVFEYIKDAETNWDNLTVYVNEEQYQIIKQRSTDWQRFTYTAESRGYIYFKIRFNKDATVNVGTDTTYIRNMRIATEQDLLNEAALLDYDGTNLLSHDYDFDGIFEPVDKDDRYSVAFTSQDGANAEFCHAGYHLAFEYVTFDYQVYGNYGAFSFLDNGETIFTVDYHQNEEWHTYYYRIPHSDVHIFEWRAVCSDGSIVYVDNINFGFFDVTLEEGLDYFDYETVTVDHDATYGFTGRYDPMLPGGYDYYAACNYDNGDYAELVFTQYMYPGDRVSFGYFFLDEDGVANGSYFDLYVDGYWEYRGDDRWLFNSNGTWYTATEEGEHTFVISYYSNADHPGDTFCVNQTYYSAVGITLDEALNVPGGDIHFYNTGYGGFVPSEGGDFYSEPHAYPVGRVFMNGDGYIFLSMTSFDLDVTEGDTISLDAYLVGYIGGVLPYGTPDDTTVALYMVSEDDSVEELIFSFTLYDLYTLWHEHDYADEYWINHFEGVVPASGHYTFQLFEWKSIEVDPDQDVVQCDGRLLVNIDNVAIAHAAAGLPGDVNCDGEVTFNDISALYLFLIGEADLTEQGKLNADLNGDGEVNFLDISALYLFLIG